MCFLKKTINIDENNVLPITNPILKKKKEKEDEEGAYDVVTYKENPLFGKKSYSVKTNTSNEPKDENGWKSFSNDIDFDIESVYCENDEIK